VRRGETLEELESFSRPSGVLAPQRRGEEADSRHGL